MTEKFTTWGNRIKRDGTLLNIEFKTKLDAKLGCKLCNQMDKDNQEYIDELDEIFKWYKEYYGETILDTKMGWNEDNKISKLEKENEQLKSRINDLEWILGIRSDITPVYSGDRNFNCCILDLIGNGRQKSVLNYLYNHYRKNDYEIKKFDNILREYEVEYGKYGWEKKK